MSILNWLTELMGEQFNQIGLDASYGAVVKSDRPDLAQFQCNGALAAAKAAKQKPRDLALSITERLESMEHFSEVTIAGPGFINLKLKDSVLLHWIEKVNRDDRLGCPAADPSEMIIVDYGGANVAKPMHVGHLRAAIIGESIKRQAQFLGHQVVGDVHLGDWGLQMGMLIAEMAERTPELPYFDPDFSGPYPGESPVTIDELAEIYPTASGKAKEDIGMLHRSRQATQELQDGRPGYMALWQHFVDVSVAELKVDYARLNVYFDLWLGESDTQPVLPDMIAHLQEAGHVRESDDALIIDVVKPDDNHELPPLILRKSDGAVLYGSTDLATILMRVRDYKPERVVYVVDRRQSDHFAQVFRAAYKTNIAPDSMELTHVDFGTMNGKDGRPFKTREGGALRLSNLLEMVYDAARQKLDEVEVGGDLDGEEKESVAKLVGVAALKFADLSNHRSKNYVFELDKFFSFEGRTGPYLLYTTVRAKSLLGRANAAGATLGTIGKPASDLERNLLLSFLDLPEVLNKAFADYAPHHLCEYAYTLATQFNRFYHEHHIMTEADLEQQGAWLALTDLFVRMEEQVLTLLGIEVPEKM
ncbi:MAG: arginine--tRNA ligase [Chloroflexota bacterium]